MRIGKAVALLGVFSLGLLIGASMTIALAGIDIDEGLSTLLGSAFGSAIAIAGAWWVATQQDRIAHEEFERFACDVVKDLHRASMIGMSVGGDLEHLDRNNSDWERYETRYRAKAASSDVPSLTMALRVQDASEGSRGSREPSRGLWLQPYACR